MEENNPVILIVEDDTPQRLALHDKLSREGFKIFQARNGVEGLRKAYEEHPQLILLDIVMPEMDGISMLKELRLDAWGKNVPVLILTNLSGPQRAEELGDIKYSDFLVKANWTLADLVAKIRGFLKS